ncbi:MAG: diguanylate cyclase [Arcobacteraceae bacterium]|nr:diguanylate cyclase [Arcobacteraceae bacterium]
MQINNNIIFNTVNNGIIILDEDLNVLAWNKWLEIYTKIKEKDILSKNICKYFPYINEKKLKRKAKTVLVTNNPSFLSLNTNRYLINIPVSNITNTIFESMQQDITILPYDIEKKYICIYIYDNTLMCEINQKLEKANEELIDMSHRDPLTQIFNRRYFSEQSKKIKSFSQRNNNIPFSIITLDIDKFKKINDTYGHLVGDEVIIKVAHIIEAEVRTSDIVARFGGEEFVMLLQDCDLDGAYKVAEKVRQDIEKTSISVHLDTEVKFTVSIGVAQFSEVDNNNIELTLSRADEALYKAKNIGRNKTVVSN